MSKIIPAIMPQNYDELFDAVNAVIDSVDLVQIDIMDGKFVPGRTWPYNMPEEPNFTAILREEDGLPFWEDLDYELDLMVQYPDDDFTQWIALGPKRMVVHVESLRDPQSAFEELQSVRDFIEIGIAFHGETQVRDIVEFLPYVDFVQCMGIETIGAQGESFDERVFESIEYLRKHYPQLLISVDGSVNRETIADLAESGVSHFVAGSAIFGEGSPFENIEDLREMAGE